MKFHKYEFKDQETQRSMTCIKNLMSNRGSNQIKFNQLFIAQRDEFLQKVCPSGVHCLISKSSSLCNVNGLYCGLHVITNLADVIEHVLNDYFKLLELHLAHSVSPTVEVCRDAAWYSVYSSKKLSMTIPFMQGIL